MAWFDIVGGLAGGLQQGLGQLQQAQQAKQVEARQQALLEIQQAQERRAGEAAGGRVAQYASSSLIGKNLTLFGILT